MLVLLYARHDAEHASISCGVHVRCRQVQHLVLPELADHGMACRPE